MYLKVTNAANHGPTSLKRLILWCLLQNRNSIISKYTPTRRRHFETVIQPFYKKKILDKDLQSIMFLPKQTVLSTDKAGIRKISKFGVNFYKPSSRSSTIIRSNGRNWFYWPPLRLVSILKNVKLNLAK